MARLDFPQWCRLGPANLFCILAARVKITASGGISWISHFAAQIELLPGSPLTNARHRGEERFRVWMPRALKEVPRCRQFYDLPDVHDGNSRRNEFNDGEVMRYKQVRQIEPLLQILEEIQDLRLDGHIESRDRFIGDNELRIERKRPCDTYALSLPSGKRVRVSSQILAVEIDQLHEFTDPILKLLARGNPIDEQRLTDCFKNCHSGIQRGKRILKNELHMLSKSSQFSLWQVVYAHVTARQMKNDFSCCRSHRAQNKPSGRSFPAATLPDQGKRFALWNGKGDIVNRSNRAADFPQQSFLDRKVLLEVLYLQ
jgi:hypothetical protein